MYYAILIKTGKEWQPVFKSDPDRTANNQRYWVGGTALMPCIYTHARTANAELKKIKKEFAKGFWNDCPIIVREVVIEARLYNYDLNKK